MTASGLEVALFRLWLAGRSQREFDFWGSKLSKIETDITVPFVPDKEILTKWLSAVLKTGFRIYKIKVSGNVEQDFTFVRDVQQLLQASLPGYTIRLDGNQGFDVSSTLLLINKLQKARIEIELFEQPLHKNDYSGFKELCPRSPVPVIVDETVFCTADCNRVINDKLAHGINIKIAKSGISTSAEIMKLSKQAGLKLMIGCMTETFVGLSAAIFLAAGTADFDYIDLDSIHFMDSFPAYDCGIDIQNRFFEILPGPQC
jgi:L-alanine-DL-glutamate epimerase-like enolase superfamily enzyme